MDILFLASWYPSRLSPQLGDFVERHAHAVAQTGVRLKVVHVAFSNRILFPKLEKDQGNTFDVFHLFLPKIGSRTDFLIRIWTDLLIKKICSRGFDPKLVHCHVAWPAGDFAISLAEKLDIPLVYTEHWAGIDTVRNPSLPAKVVGQLKRVAIKSAINLPVSNYLADLMRKNGFDGRYKVIPNCVDTSLFYPLTRKREKPFRFLHVSNFKPGIKNTEGIIEAFSKMDAVNVELTIAGDGDLEQLKHFCESKNISTKNIHFQGKLTYSEVATLNQKSDCFVLFSNFENLPCVISESHCCGNPVIATNAGGIPEMITPENGRIIKSKDVDNLRIEMKNMITDRDKYRDDQIANKARQRYSYIAVGREILNAYQSALNGNSESEN